MKWMLLLVLVVIGVGTLMGTTATPVMRAFELEQSWIQLLGVDWEGQAVALTTKAMTRTAIATVPPK